MTDATILKKIERRAGTKFLTKQGKIQKIIHEEMVAIYQDSAPLLFTVQKWSSRFKRGRESIEDGPRSGGAITAATEENVKKVEKLVLQDTRIKVKILAEMTSLSVGTIHTILHDHLNLSKVSARWVPRMLTGLQKQVRVECYRELLELCGQNPSSIFDRKKKITTFLYTMNIGKNFARSSEQLSQVSERNLINIITNSYNKQRLTRGRRKESSAEKAASNKVRKID